MDEEARIGIEPQKSGELDTDECDDSELQFIAQMCPWFFGRFDPSVDVQWSFHEPGVYLQPDQLRELFDRLRTFHAGVPTDARPRRQP